MTLTKKAGIVVLVVLLLVAAGLIPYFATRQRFIPTAGMLVYLSDALSPGHQHVWISGPSGDNARELTHGDENDVGAVFSPDGCQIAYVSDKSGDPQVCVMDADGTNTHALTIGTDSKTQPQFTPDGQSVSYISRGELITVSLRGSHDTEAILPQQQDTATGSSTETLAREVKATVLRYKWGPMKAGGDSPMALAAVLQLEDGSQELVIVPKPDDPQIPAADGGVVSLDWSPDGARLAGAIIGMSAYNPGPDITKTLPAGHELVPAGKKEPSGVFMFGLDGGLIKSTPPLALRLSTTFGPQNPAFSADGQTVAFELWPSQTPDPAKIIAIGQQAADGSSQLTGLIRGPTTDFTWAPDGTHFSYNKPVKGKPDKEDIFVYDTASRRLTNLSHGSAYATGGNWSPQAVKSS